MTRLAALTPETATGAAREMLTDLVARNGQVGEMVRTMAHSPAVLGGHLQLSPAMKRAKLHRSITERISIAVQVRQGCALCLASHVSAARSLGIDEEEIERARLGTSDDPAMAAMIAFGIQIYERPDAVPTSRSRNSGRTATPSARYPMSWGSSPSTSSRGRSISSPDRPSTRATTDSSRPRSAQFGRRATIRRPAGLGAASGWTRTG